MNGLRGLAIAWVVYHHLLRDRLTPMFGAPGYNTKLLWLNYHTLFTNGWVGVNLFFVLSGLVLYLPYASGARTVSSWRDAGSFYARRARRLFPLFYLSLGVFLLSTPPPDIGSARFFREIARLATFTYTFTPRHFMPRLNVALWSLAVEVWFSLLFPLLLIAVRRLGIRWFTIGALALSFGVRFVAIKFWSGAPVYHMVWKDSLLARLDDFAVGMAIAHWVVRRQRLPGGAMSALSAVGGVLLIVLGCLLWDNVIVGQLSFKVAASINDVLLAGIALLLYGMLSTPPAPLRLLFANRPLQLAGAMCYSIYLWHTVGARLGWDNTAAWPLPGMGAYICCILVFSALSYRYIEFPERSFRSLFLEFPRALSGRARRAETERRAESSQSGHKSASPRPSFETVSERGGPT